ncbi:ndufa6 NADH-ubiquinone oxidoreductase subunit [Thecaphora frezii]
MTTIPARLARTTQISRSLDEARKRSAALYRAYYRGAPEICALYSLDVPPPVLRAKIRTLFEKNRHIKDVAVLDVLLLKAQQDYQETMNVWKQIPHIMKWFAEEESIARPEGFLEKFYSGRDEGRGPVGQGI